MITSKICYPCFSSEVILQIQNSISKVRDKETGGLLGGGQNKIKYFWYDKGCSNSTLTKYYPDIQRMNGVLSEWVDQGIEFMGLLHSHQKDSLLSHRDFEFGVSILLANRLKSLIMSVYDLNKNRITSYEIKEDTDRLWLKD